MNFKKIKFNPKNKTLELSYNQYNGTSYDEIVNKCGQVVHSDFIDIINSLKYHFAYLCDLREIDKIDNRTESVDQLFAHTALKEITVHSVVFASDGEDDAVMLCGNKRFDGKHLNINTPLTPLTPDGYIYHCELERALEALQEEARLYLQEQKWGVVQTEMSFGMAAEFEEDAEQAVYENSVMDEVVNATPTPAKRGRKSKSSTINQPLAS